MLQLERINEFMKQSANGNWYKVHVYACKGAEADKQRYVEIRASEGKQTATTDDGSCPLYFHPFRLLGDNSVLKFKRDGAGYYVEDSNQILFNLAEEHKNSVVSDQINAKVADILIAQALGSRLGQVAIVDKEQESINKENNNSIINENVIDDFENAGQSFGNLPIDNGKESIETQLPNPDITDAAPKTVKPVVVKKA